ncbi:MAG: hypothetical protein EP330_29935 [Deltaproteobacteria bacterium]|nr:MAG: hypothetical protein EP330_29935 [Deltaproteobacteria bacterium]
MRDHAARIKHDLGKYVAFQVRWLDDDADDEELREALTADLLATRRGPEGQVDVLTVWAGFRAGLVGEQPLEGELCVDWSDNEAFRAVDAAVEALRPAVASLRAGDALDLRAARGHAFAVADACKQLLAATRDA